MPSRWHVFHIRHRTPWYVSLLYYGMAFNARRVGSFNYHARLYQVNGAVAMSRGEFRRRQTETLRRSKRDPQFLLKIMRASYRDYNRFLPLWKKIGQLPASQLSNDELDRWLEKYIHSAHTLISLALVPLYVEQPFTAAVKKLVAARLPGTQAAQALQLFLTPKKEGAVGEEYRRLLQIALLPAAKIRAALERHRRNFAWMANQLYTQTFHPLSYFRRRLQTLQKQNPRLLLARYRQERRGHAHQYQSWLRRLKPDHSSRLLVESLNEAIYYRSWRTERVYESGFIIAPFLAGVARRLNLPVKDLLFCLPREISAWLKNRNVVPKKVIAARQRGFVYLPTKPEKILTGAAVKQWENQISEQETVGIAAVRGQTAFPGTAQGPVCVVRLGSDLTKVKAGAILVTQSTTPLYVPVLHKVKAIITEEGGVLSHASVISRELKIPCVIGTKIATEVFKDGDMVEVDANKGVVRKLQ